MPKTPPSFPPSLPPSLPPGTPRLDRGEVARWVEKVRATLKLSPMQTCVAIGIWLGMSESQVAEWLDRAQPTIHAHIGGIYRRLDRMECPRGHVGVALAVERAIRRL